ncbi:MAG TPA: DUF1559 domain-containing protein [Sedimentisphaerales bacterium]|nr:DUF1559 domain-containing protein [Sedimentisphaerales bacterium]
MIAERLLQLACVATLVMGVAGAPAIGASAAEELTKRLPDGMIGFVATSGGEALKADFNKTSIGRICNDPGVRKFYQAIKAELISKATGGADDPNVSRTIDQAMGYAHMAISRPILLGVSQVAVKNGPPIGGFAILDAGDRKGEFASVVSKLEGMIGEKIVDVGAGSLQFRQFEGNDEVPLYWGWIGNHFLIAVNDAEKTAAKYVSQPRSAVPASLGKLSASGDAMLLHIDYQTISRLIQTFLREESGNQQADMFATAMKGLGLSDLKTLTARVGFAGTEVVAQGLLEMPKPTSGVFTACKPVDLAWLRVVDSRAVTASVSNWDPAGLYDTIMNTLKNVLPEEDYSEMHEGISGIESQINLRIRGDLLASLAGPTVSYGVPAGVVPEAPMGGFVVLAKLQDGAAFEKAMTALGELVSQNAQGMLQIGSQTRADGRIVHVWTIAPLAMAGMAPTWSIVSDHIVLGSNETLCDQGAAQLVSRAGDVKSLLDAEGYKKVAAQLPKEILSFTYTDSQVQFNQIMMQARQFWPMAVMMATQAGFKLPPMLPSLTQISKDMGPSCSYSYYGSDGLYSHHRGPGIEVALVAAAGGAVGAGVAMPALGRAREQARFAASMSNLKQIGLALHMYAQDRDDKFPSDLEQAERYFGNAQVLESPRKPKDFEGPSYIYIPDQSPKDDPANVLAYENPEYAWDNIVVLFLDGHVERMDSYEFQSRLEATYERLGREMPGQESDEEESEDEEDSEEEEGMEVEDEQPVVFAMPRL